MQGGDKDEGSCALPSYDDDDDDDDHGIVRNKNNTHNGWEESRAYHPEERETLSNAMEEPAILLDVGKGAGFLRGPSFRTNAVWETLDKLPTYGSVCKNVLHPMEPLHHGRFSLITVICESMDEKTMERVIVKCHEKGETAVLLNFV
eukprot:CAMPEP_0196212530 /NCGR_PEP_ID=MMETSP0912-20130531/21637_1 /TAXON_ID=49265 /ORGANISM="Thalassiosira rotula, Strain GSO102" /LENGTH=146 /DNA_ID=CAMNT_0041488497 /DNA_START=166 /DNA_END=604 /DNA_ORIENTATION=+